MQGAKTMTSRLIRTLACLPLALLLLAGCGSSHSKAPAEATYQFCFWNVENLFDDKQDTRDNADREFDAWFGKDAVSRKLKYDLISEGLVRCNAGKGPDIIAL